MRRQFRLLIIAISVCIIIFGGLAAVNNYNSIRSIQTQIKRLEDERKQLEDKSIHQKKQLDDQKKLEKQLRRQIEVLKVAKSERERKKLAILSTPVAAAAVPNTQIVSGWHYDCKGQSAAVYEAVRQLGLAGEWRYIDFIFSHESCHDPGRLNSSGCAGLGQACPGSKLPCGPNDISCQVRWFHGYAQNKGGWAASYAFWISHGWW